MFRKLSKSVHNCVSRSIFTRNNYYSTSSNQTNHGLDLEVNRMVWIDMEMTGLDVENDKIMEIACIITDADLNLIAECPEIIIHHPKTILDDMVEWCTTTHKKTGLTEACLKSQYTIEQAQEQVMDFLQKYVTEKTSPLAGNSVYMDRIFLMKYMPKVHEYLHYRIIDVSTIKELCRRWNLALYKTAPKKTFTHRALPDIRESIEELRFYKTNFLLTDLEC